MADDGGRDYLRAARDLRTAIGLNRQDTLFATAGSSSTPLNDSSGRSIHYFCDTNVIESYLRSDEGTLTPSLADLMSDSALSLSDRLTGQYILSRSLPLQRGGVLVSPSHWNELMGRLGKFETQQRREAARLNLVTPAEIDALRRLRAKPHELVAAAKEAGLGRVVERFRKLAEATELLKRLFEGERAPDGRRQDPKVETLGSHRALFDKVQDAVRNEEVRDWGEVLTNVSSTSRRDKPENIEADALTLALIQALYREHPASLGPQARKRFLFITSDWNVIRSFKRLEPVLAAEGIPNFVRHPMVYSPLINFSSIHSAMLGADRRTDSLTQVFRDVALAISSLFPKAGSGPDETSERLSSPDDLLDNIERWSAAANTIALTSGQFLAEEPLRDIDLELAHLFEAQNVVEAAKDSILHTIGQIQRNHTRTMASISIENTIPLLRKERVHGTETRAPMLVRHVDLLAPFRPRGTAPKPTTNIAQLLKQLRDMVQEQEPGDGAAARIEQVLKATWDEPVTQLLTAVIYLADGAWDSALSCTERCLELVRNERSLRALRGEARYLKALTLRMMLRSQGDLADANAAIQAALRGQNPDQLTHLRNCVERSALQVTACIVQTIESRGPSTRSGWRELNRLLPDGGLKSIFDEEIEELSDYISILGENYLGGDQPHAVAIIGQAAVNRLGAEIFRKFFPYEISHVPHRLPEVYAEMSELLTVLNERYRLPLMGRNYLDVARLELGLDADPRALAASLDRAETVTNLAQGDKVEYAYLRERVQAYLDRTPKADFVHASL